ncbi:unnamed protein product [Gadus morhua 'NCC']
MPPRPPPPPPVASDRHTPLIFVNPKQTKTGSTQVSCYHYTLPPPTTHTHPTYHPFTHPYPPPPQAPHLSSSSSRSAAGSCPDGHRFHFSLILLLYKPEICLEAGTNEGVALKVFCVLK